MVSELNGNLVVRFTDYSTDEPFLSFLGNYKPVETARTILNYCVANNLPASLRLVPHTTVNGIDVGELIVEEDRDNFDYVLSVSALNSLSGSGFQTKRYKANKFRKRNPSIRIESLDLSDAETQRSIYSVVDRWETDKLRRSVEYEIEHELEAIKRLFATATCDMYLAVGVASNLELLGFVIIEVLNIEYSVLHFWKCDGRHAGVYDFLLQQTAQLLEVKGVKYINFEQDLGIQSLRHAKASYRPSHFLKKYVVSLPV